MPTSAKRACPKCGKATQGRCDCQPRGGKVYNHKWQQERLVWLNEHPLCSACLEQGKTTLATVVDHVVPHKGDAVLFWDSTGNWQSLCATCHNRKSATEI